MLKSVANLYLLLSYKTTVNTTNTQQVNSTLDTQTHYINSASMDFKHVTFFQIPLIRNF